MKALNIKQKIKLEIIYSYVYIYAYLLLKSHIKFFIQDFKKLELNSKLILIFGYLLLGIMFSELFIIIKLIIENKLK